MKSSTKEKGAVAVEMAILLPLLLLIIVGIIEFGRVFNVQISLTHAAREGARHAAIHHHKSSMDVEGTALRAAPSLEGLAVAVSHDADSCSPGSDVRVATSVDLPSMTGFLDAGFFGSAGVFPVALTGVGVMRCGG